MALKVAKQYQGRPRRQARQMPQTGSPVQDHVVAGLQAAYVVADRLDHAGRFVAEQVREVVADPALPVVQVGVADPAGLDRHHRLARSGVGHEDVDELDRCVLGAGDDSLDLLRHEGLRVCVICLDDRVAESRVHAASGHTLTSTGAGPSR